MTAGGTLGSCGGGRGCSNSTSRGHQSGGRGRGGSGGRGRGGGGRGCRRIREDVGRDVAGVSKADLLGAVRQRNDLEIRRNNFLLLPVRYLPVLKIYRIPKFLIMCIIVSENPTTGGTVGTRKPIS
jgi:hypothetical protein